jgi:hypothetical protein
MTNEEISNALNEVLTYHCSGNWDIVLSYFGEELASELDFISDFDFDEVYQRGDLKECAAYAHIGVIQKCLVDILFDIDENAEAGLTYLTLQYHVLKLSDIANGESNHIWLH